MTNPNEPALTCSEVVERLPMSAKEVVRYDHCSKCESAITQIGHWEHIDKVTDANHTPLPKVPTDEWRERRVQELEEALRTIQMRYDTAGNWLIAEKALAHSEWREQIRKGAKHE